MSELKSALESAKLQHIREAALDAFLVFGFKRTSMEDIARNAGMSRAALYLHFKNKGEIYCSVVAGIYEQSSHRFEGALDPKGAVAETVAKALRAKDDGLMARVLASPHGAEITSVGMEHAHAEVAAGDARIQSCLAGYFRAVLADRGVAPATDPDELARFIMQAFAGFYGKAEANHTALLGRSAAALLGAD